MKLLIVIDEWGWAFEFFARGWKKYSKHEIEIIKYNGLRPPIVAANDAVFAMSTVVYQRMCKHANVPADKLVVGIRSQYSHEMPGVGRQYAGFIANSKAAYDKALAAGAEASKLHYLQGAIDGNIFTHENVAGNTKVGWAGNPNHEVKRVRLMKGIAEQYGGVVKKSEWGPPVFVPGKTRDSQVAWLRTLGCYLQTSSHEGLSQALMEAFACGVPVVATPAGDTSELVPEEWLIPINSEGDCVSEANRKISMLFEDKELARQVGIENRRKFEDEGWCWSKRVHEYDLILETCVK